MSEKKTVLSFKNVFFSYKDGSRKLVILKNASFDFTEGTFYSIIGPSGSGKTTTLALAGALDVPESGTVLFEGKDLRKIGLTKFRRDNVAMVFQSYNLISYMTALENVQMAMEISGKKVPDKREKSLALLEKLGLSGEECKRNVRHLSGGQQQRVAIARALASEARIILADEPTGNLDTETAEDIVRILKELAGTYGKCVITVTHSVEVSKKADSVLRFNHGTMAVVR
jgi:putative ABC transport system ATP-binding protein